MGDQKKKRTGTETLRTLRDQLGGASLPERLAGATILRSDIATDPTKPVREAIGLLAKTGQSFKSKHVAEARELLQRFVDLVVLPRPSTEAPEQPISLRVDDALAMELGNRGEISGPMIKRELTRYYTVMREELMRANLTPEQAWELCQLAHARDPQEPPRLFLARFEDALGDPRLVNPKPNIDTELLDRLRELGPAGLAAVLDGVDQFWRVYPHYEDDEVRAMHRVGLLPPSRFGYGGKAPEIVSSIKRAREK